MERKTTIQYVGNSPVYPDDFGHECERSCKGSLHLRPKRVLQITEDELKHIREKRPDISPFVKELPKPREAAVQVEKKEPEKLEEPPKKEVAPVEPNKKEEEKQPPKKEKRRGRSILSSDNKDEV